MSDEITATASAPNRKKGKWGRACYFRRPDGRITVNQYAGTQLGHFAERGFQRLPKYGDVTRFLDKAQEEPDPAGNWGPILRHPDGPAEFTAEQVLVARWYKAEICPVPGVKFPQLKGMKIQEYQCPNCKRLPFITAEDAGGKPVVKGNGIAALGSHLQVAHDWDRLVLLAYGERVGIDFNIAGDEVHSVVEYQFGEEEAEQSEAPEQPEFEVEEATAEEAPTCECGWQTKALKPKWPQSMATHRNLHCPARKKEPVPA